MKQTMSKKKIKEMILSHEAWLDGKQEGKQADFSNVDIGNYDFSHKNLNKAIFCGANLKESNFYKTSLFKADFCNAQLCRVNFGGSDISRTNFNNSDMFMVNMQYANIELADFTDANLTDATFRDTGIENTDFSSADMSGTDFRGSRFKNVNLENVYMNEYTTGITMSCPEKGSFIGYKKAQDKIVMLEITEDAKRSSATTLKCRCSKAKVLAIKFLDGSISKVEYVVSDYDPSFIYEVGEIIEVPDFDNDRWSECSTGIHFFMSEELARKY